MTASTALLREWFGATITHLRERLQASIPRSISGIAGRLSDRGHAVVIAFGKAARPMAEAALRTLPADRVRGLLVPPTGDDAPLPPLEVIPGGHPLPDAGSRRAAARALELCHAAGPDDQLLFLVSGGGSAMLEAPIDLAVSVEEWRRFYRALVGSGAGIERINAIRRRLSAVKGGQLALAASSAGAQTTLFVVDVPGSLQSVASGPTMPFADDRNTVLEDLRRLGLTPALPAGLRARIERGDLPPLPPADDDLRRRCAWLNLLDESHACKHAVAMARASGMVVDASIGVDDWPVEPAVARLLEHLEQLHRAHPGRPVAVVTTGELLVPLPPDHGVGGRNLQFALHGARRIGGRPITISSCGTDGIDGNSPAAGAVVDDTTVARARAAGLDVRACLVRCDAFPLLDAIGDTVITGPTGINVRDLRVLVHGA